MEIIVTRRLDKRSAIRQADSNSKINYNSVERFIFKKPFLIRTHKSGVFNWLNPKAKHRAFGESLFFVWPKKSNQKKGHPACWFLLRKNSLPPARFCGSPRRAIHGPPWLDWASCPIDPQNPTSTRPKEGFDVAASPGREICGAYARDVFAPSPCQGEGWGGVLSSEKIGS